MPDRHFELPARPSLDHYREQAEHLRHAYAAGDPAAGARVADVLGVADRFLLGDAQYVLAQEHGFRTWTEFRHHLETHVTTADRPVSRLMGVSPAIYAAMAGTLLTELRRGDPGALLRMLARPEMIPGVRFGKALGVPRAALDVLLGKATDLDLPLVGAARSGRVAYVRLLLDAGADPGTRKAGGTPLEHAIYHGHTETVDLLAGHAIVPGALWTYAACGRLDLVRACFDADGGLRPDAAPARPDLADTGAGFPSRLPPTGDPAEIVGEAFVHACQHGRLEVVRWFLDHGVRPDVAPYLGRTGLHWAIAGGRPPVVRLLLERGADPSVRDDLLRADAAGWLRLSFAARPDDPVARRLRALLGPRPR